MNATFGNEIHLQKFARISATEVLKKIGCNLVDFPMCKQIAGGPEKRTFDFDEIVDTSRYSWATRLWCFAGETASAWEDFAGEDIERTCEARRTSSLTHLPREALM
jgi:hypothetical protein